MKSEIYQHGRPFQLNKGDTLAHIIKIIRMEDKGERAKITVQLDDGMEAVVYVGGQVEVYMIGQEIRAFVRKTALPKVDKPID